MAEDNWEPIPERSPRRGYWMCDCCLRRAVVTRAVKSCGVLLVTERLCGPCYDGIEHDDG